MKRRMRLFRVLRGASLAMLLPLVVSVAGAAYATPNELRWNGHATVLEHGVAWQQEDRDGRWVTFVLLTDRLVPPEMLADTRALDPDQLSQDAQIAKRIGASGLLFPVMTGGIPVPSGKQTQQRYDIWFRDGKQMRATSATGAGGVDIEVLTASRIKGRTVRGRAGDPDAWSVSFDLPIAGGSASRMSAQGEALGRNGGLPGRHLVAALEAMRKKDYAALGEYASPDLAEFLKDASQRESRLTLFQSNAGDGQQVVNGLRSGDRASVYWVKTYRNPKIRNLRCSDAMAFLNGKWRSMESNCAVE